jgi:hypothetical protein
MTKAATLSDDGFCDLTASRVGSFRQRAVSATGLSPSFVLASTAVQADVMKVNEGQPRTIQNVSRSRRPSFGYAGQRFTAHRSVLRPSFGRTLTLLRAGDPA